VLDDVAEDHYKEAMILHRAVQTSLSMLSRAAGRSAARKLAHKVSCVGLFETVIDLCALFKWIVMARRLRCMRRR